MKKFVSAVTFLVGVIVGVFLLYMTIHKNVTEEFDRKEKDHKAIIKHLQENKSRTSIALEEALDEKEATETKLANLHRELGDKENEIRMLREENMRLKTMIAEHESGSASSMAEAPATSQTEEPKKETDDNADAALLKEMKDLLARIELNPGDRNLIRELLNKAEHIKNIGSLKSFVEKLGKVLGDAIAANPENTDLLFNRGNVYGLELIYVQSKMNENPMIYGQKMGEIAIKAIECFDKVVSKKPKDNEALLTRAFWQYHMPGKIDDARKDFDELVRRVKEQSFDQDMGEQVYAGLAMTCIKSGKKDEARKAVEEGLALYPRSEQLRRLLEKTQK